ncbi:TIGR03435 family protein [Edaphobacter sp.]|uniref:TIGR03435 family protein n=1 Tax=Edaphobacter sp. TaxID=1934404 RepID=UPI002DBB2DD4|nr:TIGR03435 family protein [Edaphobacter sp.]HEU5342535.1 TIGR03435 family protein [Edaphobacter sp.]
MSFSANCFFMQIGAKGKRLLTVGMLLAMASVGYGQTSAPAPADNLPRFEVATIKPVDPEPGVIHEMGVNVYPGGRLVIRGLSLKALIDAAFGLSYWQLSGGSDWMDKVRYDVQAKAPQTAQTALIAPESTWFSLKNKQMQQMLQALLIDRFQLKFHRETKTGTVLILEKSGKPLKLRPTKETANDISGDFGRFEGRGISGHNASMDQLAKFLSNSIVHRPVLNETGLEGQFDFESKTVPTNADSQNNDPYDANSAFLDAVREIGLRLRTTKGPVEMFVIDHAERPSPN